MTWPRAIPTQEHRRPDAIVGRANSKRSADGLHQKIQIIILAAIALFGPAPAATCSEPAGSFEEAERNRCRAVPPSQSVRGRWRQSRPRYRRFRQADSKTGPRRDEAHRPAFHRRGNHGAAPGLRDARHGLRKVDLDTLRQFLAPDVFDNFAAAIIAAAAKGYVVGRASPASARSSSSILKEHRDRGRGYPAMRFLGGLFLRDPRSGGRIVEGAPSSNGATSGPSRT